MARGFDGGSQPKLLALSDAYSHHGAALRASLRAEYQIIDMRKEGVLALAELVEWLPRGCALWRSVGGPLAWSEEVAVMHGVEFRVRELAWMQSKDGSKNKNRPKPPAPPKYAHEAAQDHQKQSRKGEAFRRRQARLHGRESGEHRVS